MQNTISKPVKAQFELQTATFRKTIEGITEEAANTKSHAKTNSIKWVAGHIANTRTVIIGLLTGVNPNPDYIKFFGRGSTGNVDSSFPTMQQILDKWDETAPLLSQAIESASTETLMAKPPIQTSIPDETMLGMLAYMALHEAHHLGQLSVLKNIG